MKQLKPGSKVLNKYVIEKLMQTNQGSVVYSGNYNNGKEKCVIKIFAKKTGKEEELEKFHAECATLSRISSNKNFVKVLTTGIDKNNVILVTEYFDGETLRQFLLRKQKLSLSVVINIFLQVLNGIKELHNFEHQIIHRDLKPENIMISPDMSKIIILDFGIATVYDKRQQGFLTETESVYGTYAYLIPDCIKKDGRNPTVQYDFYSLGVILYELLTNNKPFYSDDYENQDVIKLPEIYDPMPISSVYKNIPASLDNVIYKLLATKKDDIKFRYNNVHEIIYDIEKIRNSRFSLDETLIKPASDRVVKSKESFLVEKTINEQRFYETWSFFISVTVVLIVLVTLVIITILL